MAMEAGMLWGMALIVAGLVVAAYGPLPRRLGAVHAHVEPALVVSAPEDAWTAVPQYVDQDGNRLAPFGPDPKGMVVYD